MKQYSNGGILIESLEELPELPEKIENLYFDTETTSRNPNLTSLDTFGSCWVAGFNFSWDDHAPSYYLPVEHHNYDKNLPFEETRDYILRLLERSTNFIAHNAKYDVHVLNNSCGIDALQECDNIIDTVTTSKIINSDLGFKGGYGLDSVSKHFLKEDISSFEDQLQPYLKDNKDYGRIPPIVMAEYACQDIVTLRKLHQYIEQNLPEDCRFVYNTEIATTPILVKMERNGIRVDPLHLMKLEVQLLQELIILWNKIKESEGWHVNPSSSRQIQKLLCGKYELPIIKLNEDGNASFDRDALEKYLTFPKAPRDTLKTILEYRRKSKLLSGFVTPYRETNKEGVIHCSFNQAVRTGRMSCSNPNLMQLNLAAKELIEPDEGNAFLNIDFSQLEFRLIIHYINDPRAIAAYRENPRTDFHQWVADQIPCDRKPAKNMNFCMGYGGGKDRATETLMAIDEVVAMAQARVEKMDLSPGQELEYYDSIIRDIAVALYIGYHAKLPSLKSTMRKVAAVVSARAQQNGGLGWATNMYGRRRHIEYSRSYIGFNSVNQATAADIIKERTVELDHWLSKTPIKLLVQVHDSLLLEGPKDMMRDRQTLNDLMWIMENPLIKDKLRVPIKTNVSYSDKSWAGCDAKENDLTFDCIEPELHPFAHLAFN